MEKLKAAQQEVTKDSAQSCFEAAKVGFDRQREVLVQTEEAAGAALEHAFDFMEQAFENGEEMVVFVTELTITSESARFLSEHTCERYLTSQQTAFNRNETSGACCRSCVGTTDDFAGKNIKGI